MIDQIDWDELVTCHVMTQLCAKVFQLVLSDVTLLLFFAQLHLSGVQLLLQLFNLIGEVVEIDSAQCVDATRGTGEDPDRGRTDC